MGQYKSFFFSMSSTLSNNKSVIVKDFCYISVNVNIIVKARLFDSLFINNGQTSERTLMFSIIGYSYRTVYFYSLCKADRELLPSIKCVRYLRKYSLRQDYLQF